MDEVWERAVETAVEGQTDWSSVKILTLDGAVKCVHGRLPPPGLLEKFQSLEHLSVANVGVSSLEKFPCLKNLQKLILSDNRIAGGLEFLVEAGLDSLRDLDLSNNRIQYVEDLAPLARLRLVSLDLYECPVTRIKDYRSRVFGLIRSLKYLDKMDADENERPESDEEEDEEDVEDDDDPGSGEIDGEDRSGKLINGGSSGGVLEVDEDEESDADEEETETVTVRIDNGVNSNSALGHRLNGFRVAGSRDEDVEDVEDVDDEDDEEIDEENGEDEDVVEVHEIIDDSDEDEDGVEEDDDEEEEDDVEDEEEDVEPRSTGPLTSTEGEIDGHEQGEEDENGEIGEEEEQGVEEDGEYEEDDGEGEDEEEDFGSEYLMQPIAQAEEEAAGSDYDPGNEDDVEEEEVEDEEDLHSVQMQPKRKRGDGDDDEDLNPVQIQPSSFQPKRKRGDGEEDDGSIEDGKSSRHH
ncbi:acidic leucine-rich nuclear phosphoprotein 32-related protein-like [Tasmannia lanceolata]|uniref:acidic leucine-rich nuclear phosphoprotein 32-related protein-like n=1 Tax=Tasmannia lanceolata TaxID=3420 RepID=UPI0040649B36